MLQMGLVKEYYGGKSFDQPLLDEGIKENEQ